MITSTILLLIVIFLFSYSFYQFAFYRPPNFPPGPPRLPVWGSYWILLALNYNFPSKALHWLSSFYGSKLIGLYLASIPVVVVHGSKAIKEMFFRQEFDGRMDILLGRLRADGEKMGIFFTDGSYWHEQRRFALRHMRDWGFGRRSPRLEQLIEDEITMFVDFIRNPPKDQNIIKKDLVYLPDAFHVPFINAFLGVIRGTPMDRSQNAYLTDVGRNALLFLRSGDDTGGALSLTPWITYFAPNASGYGPLKRSNQFIVDFIKSIIKECKENLADEYDQNFFDKYIKQLKEQDMLEDESLKDASTFSEAQLAILGTDFMFPTAGATGIVLSLLIRELIYRPEVQDKIHAELDSVVGRGRLPNLTDRKNLPYLEACMRETMRHVPIVPLGIPHRAMINTTFEGYTIPKDTMIVANLWSYHMDPEIWGDPENFRPERFIDENNQLVKDITLTFGAGKRLCAGETFARYTMFLVIAGVLQNFYLSVAGPKPKILPGISTNTENFWVRFKFRD